MHASFHNLPRSKQVFREHRSARQQIVPLSSFFKTPTVRCDASEPKAGKVKEKETVSEEAENEKEENPEEVSLVSSFRLVFLCYSGGGGEVFVAVMK